MDYNSTLSWLQNLLGNQQGVNQSDYQQALGTQNNQFMSELANRLALQQGATQGQLAIQAPQLQTQKDLQAAELANRLALQGGQLGEQGREFNVSTDLAKQLQQFNINHQTQQDALNNYYRMFQTSLGPESRLPTASSTPALTYAGRGGAGSVRANNPQDLLAYWRWQNS